MPVGNLSEPEAQGHGVARLSGKQSGLSDHHHHQLLDTSELVSEASLFGQGLGDTTGVNDISIENCGLRKDSRTFWSSIWTSGLEIPPDYAFSSDFDMGLDNGVPLPPQ
jgi:hypothetical protein